jgi:nucleotide-binding universal stress UspA family protein
MIEHLIIALDGSQASESILPMADAIASALRASVTLLHLLEDEPPASIHGEPHLATEEAAEHYLDEIARARFSPEVNVRVHVDTGGVEDVALGLAQHGTEMRADLLVMCVHGRRGVSEALFGSLAQKSLALGRVPVLMSRELGKSTFPCRSILAPLDGKPAHLAALGPAVEMARAFASRIELLTVVPTFGSLSGGGRAASRLLPGTTSRMLEISAREAQAAVAEQAASLAVQGVGATGRVQRGDAARRILRAAARADLVVLATHGRAGAGAFWAGSVGSRVCAASPVPVLLVPAATEAPA